MLKYKLIVEWKFIQILLQKLFPYWREKCLVVHGEKGGHKQPIQFVLSNSLGQQKILDALIKSTKKDYYVDMMQSIACLQIPVIVASGP